MCLILTYTSTNDWLSSLNLVDKSNSGLFFRKFMQLTCNFDTYEYEIVSL